MLRAPAWVHPNRRVPRAGLPHAVGRGVARPDDGPEERYDVVAPSRRADVGLDIFRRILAWGMAEPILVALEVGVLVGFVLSVALGLYLWGRLRRVGGLELALAHVVANPPRRRAFVWTVGISFGAFVSAGVVETLSDVFSYDAAASLAIAVLLLAGGVGLLVLIASILRISPLSLSEEWNLAKTAARASAREAVEELSRR